MTETKIVKGTLLRHQKKLTTLLEVVEVEGDIAFCHLKETGGLLPVPDWNKQVHKVPIAFLEKEYTPVYKSAKQR